MTQKVLITGGLGYIGAHVSLECLREGYEIVIVDNLSNSSEVVLSRLQEISKKNIAFSKIDIRNVTALKSVFERHEISGIIHLAGLKSVKESSEKPLHYYNNNVVGSIQLIDTALQYNCGNFIFSSSATVYGTPSSNPISEAAMTQPINPYGNTKLMVEMILDDLAQVPKNKPGLNACSLRYFNPLGADITARIGEDPKGIPSNLMPFITQVAIGKREKLSVFGNSYDTVDGTGVRDYIHVVDLARGHIKALSYLESMKTHASHIKINLGTGKGYSVLEILKTFEVVTGITIPFEFTAARQGDAASCFADPTLARRVLNWAAEFSLEEMCRSQWAWQVNNPNGYLED